MGHFVEGKFVEERWLIGDSRWLSREALVGPPWGGGEHVAAADQSTSDGVLCGRGDNAASVPGLRRPDLAPGKVVSQLHLGDGQWWWKGGRCGPPRANPLSPIPHACRCGDLYLCILLYLFICLANQRRVTFPN